MSERLWQTLFTKQTLCTARTKSKKHDENGTYTSFFFVVVSCRLLLSFSFALSPVSLLHSPFFLSFLLSNHFPTICSIHLILNIYFSSQKANRINRERTKTKSKSSIAHGSKQREREELVKSLCENYRLRKLTNKYTNSCGGGGNKTTKKVKEENRGKYII